MKGFQLDDRLCLDEQFLKFLEQQNCINEQELMVIYLQFAEET